MEFERIDIPLNQPVGSLHWHGDRLIDSVGGNRTIHLDGTVEDRNVIWGYRFDAAVGTSSGRYAVIYERFGTKGLIVEGSRLVREINRSFYFAGTYDYPIVLFQHPDGRELIAHCPNEYNRIEIEETASGKKLTDDTDRKPDDFFHSRLAVSADNRRLLSAGWMWHPFDTVATWSIDALLADARMLDNSKKPFGTCGLEINSAAFIDGDRVLVSSNPDADDLRHKNDSALSAGCLGIYNLASNEVEHVVKAEETVGNMLWLGNSCVLGLYENPKVFDLQTGNVILRWSDIATGKRNRSIINHTDTSPPMALDATNKRLAVASPTGITILRF